MVAQQSPKLLVWVRILVFLPYSITLGKFSYINFISIFTEIEWKVILNTLVSF